MYLFFDTETTGLPDFKKRSSDPAQPDLVQVAALLVDTNRVERASLNLIIEPNGWTIPDEMAKIHGITQEIAMEAGVDMFTACVAFRSLSRKATTWVAHNASFDLKMMKIQHRKAGLPWLLEEIENEDADQAVEIVDTCGAALYIVNLPPTPKMLRAGFDGPKRPNLGECVRFFFDRELEGAHDAMVDVRACRDIYFAMKDRANA